MKIYNPTIKSLLEVTGSIEHSGSLAIKGDLDVNGSINASSFLNVISSSAQLTYFDNNLDISGSLVVTGSILTSGSLNVLGSIVTDSVNVLGLTSISEVSETIVTDTVSASTKDFDLNSGSVFVITSINQNSTFNVINVPTTNNQSIAITFVIIQGATAYLPTAFQINSNPITPNWIGASLPSGTTNSIDIVGFVIFRYNDAYTTIASLNNYDTV